MGVVKTLFEQKLLPNIISGSSSGSVVVAIYFTKTLQEIADNLIDDCTQNFDAFQENKVGTLWTRLKSYFTTGSFLDIRNVE